MGPYGPSPFLSALDPEPCSHSSLWNGTGEDRAAIIQKKPADLTVAGEWNRTGEVRVTSSRPGGAVPAPNCKENERNPPMPRLTQLDRFGKYTYALFCD